VGIEFLLNGAMEALADTVGLRMSGLGAAVVDILHRQVQLIFVMLALAALFCAAIGEHAQQRDFLLLERRQYTVIEYVGGHQSIFCGRSLAKATLVYVSRNVC
jgi:hypothetical protein